MKVTLMSVVILVSVAVLAGAVPPALSSAEKTLVSSSGGTASLVTRAPGEDEFVEQVQGLRGLAGPPAVGESAQQEDDQQARAEVEQLLTALEARIATISAAQRECAPEVDLLELARVFRENLDSPFSRIEARRLMQGVVELENLVQLYVFDANQVCSDYHEAERLSAEFTRIRTVTEEHLIRAATAIQSRMPSSVAELNSVLSFHNGCNNPSAHDHYTMLAVREPTRRNYDFRDQGTPFRAMNAFVHVANDGVIRARHSNSNPLGVEDATNDPFRGVGILSRNHTYLEAHADHSGFRFRLCVKRTFIESKSRMLERGKNTASRGLTELPELATIANIAIGRLVRDARRFAANSCARTVNSGALLARVFEANAPRNEDAARTYRDAASVMRAEIEAIAATGAADLCNGQNADLRALARPAVERAAGVTDHSAVERDLFIRARREAELALREHARNIATAFLLGQ